MNRYLQKIASSKTKNYKSRVGETLRAEAQSRAIKKGLKLTNKRVKKTIEAGQAAHKILKYHTSRKRNAKT